MLLGTAQRMKSHGHKIEIIHNGSKVNSVTEYCYLGSIIDQHLSLTTNLDRAYKKAAARLRLHVRRYLTTKASKSIYELMIIPLLTYSSAIKTTYTRTQLTKLDSLERSASKIIGGTTPAKSILGCVEKQVCSPVSYTHLTLPTIYSV